MKFLRPGWTADEMPFLDHLEELRWRILWSMMAVLVGAVGGFVLVTHFDVLGLLIDPIRPYLDSEQLKYLSPTDPFFITLQLGLTIGLILCSPLLIYQTWAFISPALRPEEKRAIIPSLFLGLLLFAGGIAVAYFGTLPFALRFMMSFQVDSLQQSIIIGAYLSFVVRLLLAFGLAFELPVVIMVLSVLGVVDSEMLASKRRYAIVAATVLASLVTPGDVVSTLFLMGPLILLFELGIGLAKLVERGREKDEAADETWAPGKL